MNIKITREAREQIAVLRGIPAVRTGFLLGWEIGKHKIIRGLFPVEFNPESIDNVYAGICTKMGAEVLGVFFNSTEPFESDWFTGDLVLRLDREITDG